MNPVCIPSKNARAAPIGTRCEKPQWFERRTPHEYQALYTEQGLNGILPEMTHDAERLQRALLNPRTTTDDDRADIHTAIGWACAAGILVMVALLALHIL